MTARGYVFANIDINRSDASKFVVDEENNAVMNDRVITFGLDEKQNNRVRNRGAYERR